MSGRILAAVLASGLLPALVSAGAPTADVSWSSTRVQSERRSFDRDAGFYVVIQDPGEFVENCEFQFEWATTTERSGSVRVGWRGALDRPDDNWLYAHGLPGDSPQDTGLRCEVRGDNWVGSTLRIYVPLLIRGLGPEDPLWIHLTGLELRTEGGGRRHVEVGSGNLAMSADVDEGPPVVRRVEPPAVSQGAVAEVYLTGTRLNQTRTVTLTASDGREMVPSRVEQLGDTVLRVELPLTASELGVWKVQLIDAMDRVGGETKRLSVWSGDRTVRDARGEEVLGALDIDGARAIPGEVIVLADRGALRFPDERRSEEVPIAELECSRALRSVYDRLGVQTVRRVFTTQTETNIWTEDEGQRRRIPDLRDFFVLTFPVDRPITEVIEMLRDHGSVIWAEPNYLVSAQGTPNDALFDLQWAVNPAVDPSDDIGAIEAWDRKVGDGPETWDIAVIDTGIDHRHADLGNGIGPGFPVVGGFNFLTGTSDAIDDSWASHGTQVAGIIGAITSNGQGIAGVAGGWAQDNRPGISMYAMKAGDVNGNTTIPVLANAIQTSSAPPYDTEIEVVGFGDDPNFSNTLKAAILAAYVNETTLIFPKGNGGTSAPRYPADLDPARTISVGGSDAYGDIWEGSNRGNGIDLVAPCSLCMTLTRTTDCCYVLGGGTSLAAAHAAGVASLLLRSEDFNGAIDEGIDLQPEDYQGLLTLAAAQNDRGIPGYDNDWGHGFLDADETLKFVEPPYEIDGHFFTGTSAASDEVFETYITYVGNGPLGGPPKWVRLHQLTKHVAFSDVGFQYSQVAGAWGVGHVPLQTGWDAASLNFQTRYCQVVPGTVTTTGCDVRTFVHEVYQGPGIGFLGWYPQTIGSTRFVYTVVGIRNPPAAAEGLDSERADRIALRVWPNPFSSRATIQYMINGSGPVRLSVYDVTGARVSELIKDDDGPEGAFVWNGRDLAGNTLASGVYFFELQRGEARSVYKGTLLR